MTGYDRHQLAWAERMLEEALRQLRWARERMDDEAEVAARCFASFRAAGEASRILRRAFPDLAELGLGAKSPDKEAE